MLPSRLEKPLSLSPDHTVVAVYKHIIIQILLKVKCQVKAGVPIQASFNPQRIIWNIKVGHFIYTDFHIQA